MKTSTRKLTQAGLLAALYVVLTFAQNLIFPDSASMAVQFRISEALCVFALFTPAAIWGLGLGCLIFNLTYMGALPLDFFVGTGATLLATLMMYRFRNVKVWKLPLLSLLMPALANGLLVGWELTVYIGNSFWLNAALVAAGEAAVLLTLGTGLYFLLSRPKLQEHLFGR